MAPILEFYTCPEKLHSSTGRRKKLKLLSKNLLKEAGKFPKWLLEALNIIRDHKLERENIIHISHEDLMKFRNKAIRAVSGSVIGFTVNSAISPACPLFIVPACLNGWQTFVSGSNLHRVRREMKRRASSTDFQQVKSEFLRRKRNHMAVAIATGATIKLAFVAAALGIIGFDNIIDSCLEMFAPVDGSHAAGAATAAATVQTPPHFSPYTPDSPSGDGAGAKCLDDWLEIDLDSGLNDVPTSRADQLATDHPIIYSIDKNFTEITAPGAECGQQISEAILGDGNEMTMEMSWNEFLDLMGNGDHSALELLGTGTLVALINEGFQPVLHAGHIAVDKGLDHFARCEAKGHQSK